MAISEGDQLPEATLVRMGDKGPEQLSTTALTAGRKVLMFGMPGAFTGTCTDDHLPSILRSQEALAAKGIDEIYVVTVNDPFVVKSWGDATGAAAAGISLVADPASDLTKATGLNFSAPPVGFYDRTKRSAMLIEDGKVTMLRVDENPGTCDVSSGDSVLSAL